MTTPDLAIGSKRNREKNYPLTVIGAADAPDVTICPTCADSAVEQRRIKWLAEQLAAGRTLMRASPYASNLSSAPIRLEKASELIGRLLLALNKLLLVTIDSMRFQ